MSWQQGATNSATPPRGYNRVRHTQLLLPGVRQTQLLLPGVPQLVQRRSCVFYLTLRRAPGVRSILASMHIGAQVARVLIHTQCVSVQSLVMGRSPRSEYGGGQSFKHPRSE